MSATEGLAVVSVDGSENALMAFDCKYTDVARRGVSGFI